MNLHKILISQLTVHPLNPRSQEITEDIKSLATNILNIGLLQPITVTKTHQENKYHVLYGSRRFLACKVAGFTEIPAFINNDLTEEEIAINIIAENDQREEMHPMREALTYKSLCIDNNLSINKLAELLDRPIYLIKQKLALCNLIPDIQKIFSDNLIIYKDALALSTISLDDQKKAYKEYKKTQDISDLLDPINSCKNKLETIYNWNIEFKNIPNCNNCQFNSHVSTLFQNDLDKTPICSNSKCFDKKSILVIKTFIDNNLDAIYAKESYYTIPSKIEEYLKDIKIYNSNDLIILNSPDIINAEDYNNQADYKKDYINYLEELKEYNESLESGEYLKTIILKQYYPYFDIVYSKIKSKNKKIESSGNSNISKKEEIKFEISQIKEREKRKEELDDEKITTNFREIFKGKHAKYSVEYPDCTKNHLSNLEKTILINLIEEFIPYNYRQQYKKLIPSKLRDLKFDSEVQEIPINIVYESIRFLLQHAIPAHPINYKKGGFAAMQYLLMKEWNNNVFNSITTEQFTIQKERKLRTETRISKLKQIK